MNGVVALTGAATLPVGGAILVLAALPGVALSRRIDRLLWLQGGLMAGVAALGAIALLVPSLVPPVPETNSPPAFALLAAGLVFYAVIGWRALRTVVLARRASDVLVVVGIVWLAAALIPALTQGYWQLGWWLGHGFEVIGILLVGAPVALDFGKLTVPKDILAKPGALTDEEFAVMQRHPGWGDELLRGLGFGGRVRRLVLDHHERLDGTGYPNGAAAEALDLDTRILSVCDVYDALCSTRVYREAWTHERAVALLRAESGSRFDPVCVGALERVLARERPSAAAAA